jgi:amidase
MADAARQMRIHTFGDDALGEHDATSLAEQLRSGAVSTAEVVDAAITRADKAAELNAVYLADFDRARRAATQPHTGPFAGVPTFVKDNTDVAGLPSNQGSEAFTAVPAPADGVITKLLFGTGLINLGKSTMPEFGLSASTEFMTLPPTQNPWRLGYSSGASSGGSAALVACGAVPIAHANDGGGSIRIPAACCGLVGLKPSRGRLPKNPAERLLPVNLLGEGVLTRSVRDTATAFATFERRHPARGLPPIGTVTGPGKRRLRVGIVLDSVIEVRTDDETRAAVTSVGETLEALGHHVEPLEITIAPRFADDFRLYWGMLASVLSRFGPKLFHAPFDRTRLDGLTRGLAAEYRRHWRQSPGAINRLRRSQHDYARMFTQCDVMLSPVLAHTTPELGYLSPRVPFDELFERLRSYASFTPVNNVTGSPAISLPAGLTELGLPIGAHLAGRIGDERMLLELGFELEAARPWPRIQD